jgi:imidazole glycerol-phosphate synthase subunit HisH
MIAIIDYDIGNLGAVANMLQRLGVACEITADAARVAAAERIILPGNGAFDACMKGLRASGLLPTIEQRVLRDKVPLLGVCVGAQMLGHRSEEGVEPGLGWIDMTVRRFPALADLRVPHMGWNQVTAAAQGHPLLEGLADDARFYFVHSYLMVPEQRADVLLRATYGIDFAAGIARGNIAGVQFHPEKSHRFGKQLLGNFARMSSMATAAGPA